MIKKEENSFQLLLTALVLVVIAVGGTLAWFASNRTASVERASMPVTAPIDDDDFDGDPLDYYDFSKGLFDQFGDVVRYVPGKNMIFRVEAEANLNATVKLVFEGENKPVLGDVVKIGFYDSISNDWKNGDRLVESLFPHPSTTINSLAQVDVHGWTVTSPVTPGYDSGDLTNYLYFFLYMDPAAGEKPSGLTEGASYENYQNLDLRFKIKVTYS